MDLSDSDTTDGDPVRRRSAVVAAVRLPAGCQMPHTRVSVHGPRARRDSGDDDPRLGTPEFQGRFRVAVEDEVAATDLFTEGFQREALEQFSAVSFELWGDLAVVVTDTDQQAWNVGTDVVSLHELDEIARRAEQGLDQAPPDARRPPTWPTETTKDRLGTRTDVVDALLEARATAVALLSAMPEGWWRTVGAVHD